MLCRKTLTARLQAKSSGKVCLHTLITHTSSINNSNCNRTFASKGFICLVPDSRCSGTEKGSSKRMRQYSFWNIAAATTTALLINNQYSTTTTTSLSPFVTAFSTSSTNSNNFSNMSTTTNGNGVSSDNTNTVVGPLTSIQARLVNSWIKQLSTETPENLEKSLKVERLSSKDDKVYNKHKRPVYNGHYVQVQPSGLPYPRLVLTSRSVAQDWLQLSENNDASLDQVLDSDEFLSWVSGNLPAMGPSWATPYALSIMGTPYTHNCPYGANVGYGDGRALSIGEIGVTGSNTSKKESDNNEHNNNASNAVYYGYELQLKGAGKTPFCRGADGRAVLRSSVREFLASEAMHYLGVSSTRALSLVVSDKEKVQRPWYQTADALQGSANRAESIDSKLAQYPEEQRRAILQQLRQQKSDPNIMISEPAAMTCRVSPSFCRIGHVDLFSRRAEKASMKTADRTNSRYNTQTNEWKELEQLIWHVCYREYRDKAYTPFIKDNDLASAATVLLNESAERIAAMVAGWVRVGFTQGNFNADNCLIGGRTMDYGPFGWIEEYFPTFAKWTGSGEHFGFLNQPSAGLANYYTLVASVAPVIAAAQGNEDPDTVAKTFLSRAQDVFQESVDRVFRSKLGFEYDQDVADDLWQALEPLMRSSRADWTLLFRELTYIVRDFPDPESQDYEGMLKQLVGDDNVKAGSSPFYEPLSEKLRQDWLTWIEQWRTALATSVSLDTAFERMRTSNPKFVLREHLLVSAYTSAAKNEHAELYYLFELIKRPYEEGSETEDRKYYRRAPDEALTAGGTAFMS